MTDQGATPCTAGEDERLLAALTDSSSFGFACNDEFLEAASDREVWRAYSRWEHAQC